MHDEYMRVKHRIEPLRRSVVGHLELNRPHSLHLKTPFSALTHVSCALESEMADWLAAAAGVSSQTVRGVCRDAGVGTLCGRVHLPCGR